MTPEAQRIALLEWMGWSELRNGIWKSPDGITWDIIPKLTLDLMYEAEKMLIAAGNKSALDKYEYGLVQTRFFGPWHTTAEERLKALIQAIGKWVEE